MCTCYCEAASTLNSRNLRMAQNQTTVPLPEGGTVAGIDVPVSESTERWSEFKLDDGSVLKVKMTLMSAVRVDGRYDQEGNPFYVVKGQPIVTVVSAPSALKKTNA